MAVTTEDAAPTTSSSFTITAAPTAVSSVTFAGSSMVAGATGTTWTVGFTTSASGGLSGASNDTIDVYFPNNFAFASDSPVITFSGNFTGDCGSSSTPGSEFGEDVTISLGGSCALAASTSASLTIDGVTNPSANSYTGTVVTTEDAAPTTSSSFTITAPVSSPTCPPGTELVTATGTCQDVPVITAVPPDPFRSTVVATPTQVIAEGTVTSPSLSTAVASSSKVVADGTTKSTITVTLLNGQGIPIAGDAVTLTPTAGSSLISAPSEFSNSAGVVTFTVTDTAAQSVTYTATDTTVGVTLITTLTVTFSAGPVSPSVSTAVAFSPPNGAESTVTVTLLDAYGNPVVGDSVSLTPTTGTEVISAPSGPSNSAGVVTFTATYPGGDAGVITYTVTDLTEGVTLTAQPTVDFSGAPTVTSVSLSFGNSQGGDNITINGYDFDTTVGNTTVTLQGQPLLNVVVVSATQITGTTPPSESVPTAGPADIVVTTLSGAGTLPGGPGGFTYEDPPTVSGVTSTIGPLTGGTDTIITGTGLNYATSVSFAPTGTTTYIPASFTILNSTTIDAVTPAGLSAGIYDVYVGVADPTIAMGMLTGGFAYTSTASPTYSSAITITLIDATGSPVVGDSVSLTANSGSSAISAASETSNSAGVVTFTVTDTTAESVTYTATDTTADVPLADEPTVIFAPFDAANITALPPDAATIFTGSTTSNTVSAIAPTSVATPTGASPSATVTVPTGALPAGATVSLTAADPSDGNSYLNSQGYDSSQAYVLGFAVTWTPAGTADAPITLTISDPGIVAGDAVYEMTSSGLVQVGTATADGEVTITFTNDPAFLVTAPRLHPLGYVLATANGTLFGFGKTTGSGKVATDTLHAPVVAAAADFEARGGVLVDAHGAVLNYGDVAYHGSLTGRRIQSPITAVAVTPKGNGYLLVSAGGAVYAFGDVILHGSLVGRQLASPIVAVALSPDAKGYLLVESNGTVFAFGDEKAFPIHGGKTSSPVVAIATSSSGQGYLFTTVTGKVFARGDVKSYGDLSGKSIASKIVGIVFSPDQKGYVLIASNGVVYRFGDAKTFAPTTKQPKAPVIAAV